MNGNLFSSSRRAATLLAYQANAHPLAGQQMRIGIPHRGGKLAFHAFEQGYAAMVSANAFWNTRTNSFQVPSATDLSEVDFALDSAGYTAMMLWKRKGPQKGMAGIFPWGYSEYIEFATSIGASWWAQPDLCCERELAGDQDAVDYRVNATATLLEGTLRVLYAWQDELAKTSSAATVAMMLPPPVPVIQGWSISDYLRSLDLLYQVWERWQPWLASPALIGVGSVCRRNLKHPRSGLYSILRGLEGRLPSSARVHLFGVKGSCLEDIKMRPWIASVDSMAYDLGSRIKAYKQGVSNTTSHRASEMSRWMSAASDRMRLKVGDQFRLPIVV